ncbi:MAG: outer membrane lipoprotein carrier protein LolA [Oligoflexia bacterium]|nr:outer membrane lipoprotein carrier protein LolA [Oligoflexia bacterium]
MLRPFTLLFLLLLSVPVAAQGPARSFECKEGAGLSAIEGSGLLQKVQSTYSAVQALRADFIQSSYLESLDVTEVSSGQVFFQKPGLMKWVYREPAEQVFLIKADTLWFYQAEERQVLIDNFRQVLISDLPVAFLMGIGDLSRDFSLDSACRSEDGIVLSLRSKQAAQSELKSFRLLVDPRTNLPAGASISDVGNNVTTIVLNATQLQDKLDTKLFVPDFGSGLDIIDRRKESK